MSEYVKQLQRIVKEYRRSGKEWPASASELARWAIETHRYDIQTPTLERVCSRDLAQALREEYITDPKGRRVRAKHPAKASRDGEQTMLWDDIRTAPRSHMAMAFQLRRNHIVGECRQVKADGDSYNDSHPGDLPIQMVLNFTRDVNELEGWDGLPASEAMEELDETEELEAVA